jgi:hypothetical protein
MAKTALPIIFGLRVPKTGRGTLRIAGARFKKDNVTVSMSLSRTDMRDLRDVLSAGLKRAAKGKYSSPRPKP